MGQSKRMRGSRVGWEGWREDESIQCEMQILTY